MNEDPSTKIEPAEPQWQSTHRVATLAHRTERFLKKWPQMVAIIMGLGALVYSHRANSIAQDANKVATEANDLAKKAQRSADRQFIQVNRPTLLLTLTQERGQFLRVTPNGAEVTLAVTYEIKNVGNVVAKNITFPKVSAYNITARKEMVVTELRSLGTVSLAPGEPLFVTFEATLEAPNADQAAAYADGKTQLDIRIPMSYTHALESGRVYQTVRRDRVTRDTVTTIDSDYHDPAQ